MDKLCNDCHKQSLKVIIVPINLCNFLDSLLDRNMNVKGDRTGAFAERHNLSSSKINPFNV